eukprot:15353082-Ditylum_brightwellii.AAC.1
MFKPWRDDPGSLKVEGSFSSVLGLYMWNTPTEEGVRRNEEHELCFDLNDTKIDVSDPDIDDDLGEQHFEELNYRGDEIDWSEGYDE